MHGSTVVDLGGDREERLVMQPLVGLHGVGLAIATLVAGQADDCSHQLRNPAAPFALLP
jgi:hypothetical protein